MYMCIYLYTHTYIYLYTHIQYQTAGTKKKARAGVHYRGPSHRARGLCHETHPTAHAMMMTRLHAKISLICAVTSVSVVDI